MTSCRDAHWRFVAPPGRCRRPSTPQTLSRVGSSAGYVAVIGARVPHTPTGLPERSKACREARCWARVVSCASYGSAQWPEAGSSRR